MSRVRSAACWLAGCASLAALALHPARAAAPAKAGDVLQDCAQCPPMVVIPAGSFDMGARAGASVSATEASPQGPAAGAMARNPALPQHRVTIGRAFALARHEVTYEEFARFVSDSGDDPGVTGCTLVDAGSDPDVFSRDTTVNWQVIQNRGWRYPIWPNVDERVPVTCVSWQDATAYADWLSRKTGHHYRLPSEAEWEYAARAGSGGKWFWGDDASQACLYANVVDRRFLAQRLRSAKPDNHFECDDGFAFLAPVESFRPNAFGLYDMVGNVDEWSADCWHEDYTGAPATGAAWTGTPCRQRVIRGDPGIMKLDWSLLSFRRAARAGDYRTNVTGFRLARDR